MEMNNLRAKIYDFISRVGSVTVEQTLMMFRDHTPDTVLWHIKSFAYLRQVEVKGNVIRVLRTSTISPFLQSQIMQAAWVLAARGENEIRSFFISEYPTQLTFFDTEGRLYDVTNIYSQTAKEIITAAKRYFQMSTFDKEDVVHHIAVSSGEATIDLIKKSGIFSSYVIVKNGEVTFCEC